MNEAVAVSSLEETKSKSIFKTVKLYIYLFIKRFFDIICALLGLVFLIPVALIVKICYMLTGDFKSVFFSQKRIGKNGKEFKFFKFRTMIKDADEVLFKMMEEDPKIKEEYTINKKLKNDPRITKVGRVLRKSSLDELPQLLNVLLGQMSIIGNRPYLPREKEDMGTYFKDIVKTKPGLTGYWQVSGRSNCTFDERLRLEQYYSNHRGLRMDLMIFFKTFMVVILRKGADK